MQSCFWKSWCRWINRIIVSRLLCFFCFSFLFFTTQALFLPSTSKPCHCWHASQRPLFRVKSVPTHSTRMAAKSHRGRTRVLLDPVATRRRGSQSDGTRRVTFLYVHILKRLFFFFSLFLLGYSKIACLPQYGLLEGTQRISSSC